MWQCVARQLPGRGGEGRGVEFPTRQAVRDDGGHAVDRVEGEQLQHADVVPGSRVDSEPTFEGSTELGEAGRQLPVAVHRRVIESGRLAFQRPQEVKGIEDLLPAGVTASVRGDHGPITDYLDAVDVPLHTHAAEGPP